MNSQKRKKKISKKEKIVSLSINANNKESGKNKYNNTVLHKENIFFVN